MTKRRLENELDDLSDEMLRDLTPDERLELALKATAKGKEEWLDRVTETCPEYEYGRQPDLRYTNRSRRAKMMALHVIYELHTRWLQFQWANTQDMQSVLIRLSTDVEPEEVGVTPETVPAGTSVELFADLYIRYEGAARFADEELGVPLATWLAVHSRGPRIATMAGDVLDEYPNLFTQAEDELLPDSEVDGDECEVATSLNELAEMWCRGLQAAWVDAVGG